MTRLFHPMVPITVEADEDGSPRQFRWQERLHRVTRVEQRWQIDTDWWTATGRVERVYYALTTQTGLLCVVYHDRLAGVWYLSRAYD